VALGGLILFSFSGLVLSGYGLNQQVGQLRQDIAALKDQNERLQAEARYLETDAGLETLAREQFGWTKQGEVAVITIPTHAPEPQTAPIRETGGVDTPNWRRWWEVFFGK
jgi:cell division protein FtsB